MKASSRQTCRDGSFLLMSDANRRTIYIGQASKTKHDELESCYEGLGVVTIRFRPFASV